MRNRVIVEEYIDKGSSVRLKKRKASALSDSAFTRKGYVKSISTDRNVLSRMETTKALERSEKGIKVAIADMPTLISRVDASVSSRGALFNTVSGGSTSINYG